MTLAFLAFLASQPAAAAAAPTSSDAEFAESAAGINDILAAHALIRRMVCPNSLLVELASTSTGRNTSGELTDTFHLRCANGDRTAWLVTPGHPLQPPRGLRVLDHAAFLNYQEAGTLSRQFQFAAALAKADAAVRAEPRVAAFLRRRGMLLGVAREFAKAVLDLEAAAQLARAPIIELERSQMRVFAGQFRQAAKELQPLLAKLRDQPKLLGEAECSLGVALQQLGEPAGAVHVAAGCKAGEARCCAMRTARPAAASAPAAKAKVNEHTDDPETVYQSLRLSAGAVDGNGPFPVGEEVRVRFNLVNKGRHALHPPACKFERGDNPCVGDEQGWIERLGGDATIAAIPARTAREGRRYAQGAMPIDSPATIAPGAAVVLRNRIVETRGFEPGKYRYTMEYRARGGRVLRSQAVEFELQ